MRPRSALHEDALWRLDRRVHELYLSVLFTFDGDDDEDFRHLHGLAVESDPECNRLLRVLRTYILRNPEMAA